MQKFQGIRKKAKRMMFSPAYNIEGTIWRGHQVKQKKKKEA